MNDIMLDLETLGTRPGCVIVSIGAVFFDASGLGAEFSMAIDIADAQAQGLAIEADTVRWWMGQTPEAKEAFGFGGNPLRFALREFARWATDNARPSAPRVWGNGADFDLAILTEDYARCAIIQPWRYVHGRCYRTLAALYPQIAKRALPAVAHVALHDARAQALHAADILASIQSDQVKASQKLDTLAQALGIPTGTPETHTHVVHRVLHIAARTQTEAAA